MAGNAQPLDQQFPIVDAQGRPTLYFVRWAQERQIDIGAAVPQSRVLTAGVGLSGGGDLTADRTFNLANTAVVPGAYTNANITVDQQGRIITVANGTPVPDGDKGDIVVSGGGTTWTIDSNVVTFAKFVAASAASIVGATAPGNFAQLTPAQAKTVLAITAADVSGLGYFATGTDAANLSGTVAAARIAANSLSYDKLAQAVAASIFGTTLAGNHVDLTPAQAKTVLAISAADVSGLGYFATGTDAANLTGTVAAARMPQFTGGDVTTAGAGSVNLVIGNSKVTYAKIQNVSVTDRILGRASVGAGIVEEIICTAAGRALIDDADATAQRATLGLADIAGAWTAYTPTAVPTAGALTTYTTSGGYRVLGDVVFFYAAITITNKGTAAGSLDISLPFVCAAANPSFNFSGRTNDNNKTLCSFVRGDSLQLARTNLYDGTTPMTLAAVNLIISGLYRTDDATAFINLQKR